MVISIEPAIDGRRSTTTAKVAFTVREVADLLGVHRNTIYTQVKQGRIPVIYIGSKPLVPRRWIEEHFGEPEVTELRLGRPGASR
jgi:excisionase family DNA binding protein